MPNQIHKTEASQLKSELTKLQQLHSELEERFDSAEREKDVSLYSINFLACVNNVYYSCRCTEWRL